MVKRQKPKLTIKQITKGIEECISNAESLLEDAVLLVSHGRYARALTCALTADQEIGKIAVLTGMARATNKFQRRWNELWTSFYRHDEKTVRSLMNIVPDEARVDLDAVVGTAREIFVLAPTEEALRQKTLYVDYSSEKRDWASPREIDDTFVQEKLESTCLSLARIKLLKSFGFYSEAALQIQREEIAPIMDQYGDLLDGLSKGLGVTREEWQTLKGAIRSAHIQFVRRLHREGVINSRDLPREFTFYGIPWEQFEKLEHK